MSRHFRVSITSKSTNKEDRKHIGEFDAKGSVDLISQLMSMLEDNQTLEQWIRYGDGSLSIELSDPRQKQ
jgi:hypothetical protein